jgi:hypothetical protein
MALFFSVFWQFLKVSVRNSVLDTTYITILVLVAKKFADDDAYRNFRRQLLHTSLAKILDSLKPGMTTPEVVHCPDGHFRRAIYGLGPYIADYPEQCLLACTVQGWCPK